MGRDPAQVAAAKRDADAAAAKLLTEAHAIQRDLQRRLEAEQQARNEQAACIAQLENDRLIQVQVIAELEAKLAASRLPFIAPHILNGAACVSTSGIPP